mgnify:CR=1 FL=1
MLIPSAIVYEDFAETIVLEEDGVRLGCSGGAAGRCVGDLTPVRANDSEVLAIPVISESVYREAFVCIDDVVCGAGSVD